jgi:hypothetical protein
MACGLGDLVHKQPLPSSAKPLNALNYELTKFVLGSSELTQIRVRVGLSCLMQPLRPLLVHHVQPRATDASLQPNTQSSNLAMP